MDEAVIFFIFLGYLGFLDMEKSRYLKKKKRSPKEHSNKQHVFEKRTWNFCRVNLETVFLLREYL